MKNYYDKLKDEKNVIQIMIKVNWIALKTKILIRKKTTENTLEMEINFN